MRLPSWASVTVRRPVDRPGCQHRAHPSSRWRTGGGGRARRRRRSGTAARRRTRRASAPGSGGRPGIAASRRRPEPGRGGSRAGPACTGAAGAAKTSSTAPSSTIWPAYITATRSATSATSPRSWVTISAARPSSRVARADHVEHLRLHGDVERGGRLVGDEQRRVVGERHRDRDALAQPARQLVRIGPHAAARVPGRRPGASSCDHAVAMGAPPPAAVQQRSPRAIWSPMRCSGLSELSGSWKTVPTTPPRTRRIVASSAPTSSVPPARTDPRVIRTPRPARPSDGHAGDASCRSRTRRPGRRPARPRRSGRHRGRASAGRSVGPASTHRSSMRQDGRHGATSLPASRTLDGAGSRRQRRRSAGAERRSRT